MKARDWSRLWKRAAKNKLEEVQILQRAEKDYEEQLRKCYATATRRRELLGRCYKILEHAPEFPFYLIAEYDIEDLQDELAKELENA